MSAELTLDDRGIIVSCESCAQKNRLPYDQLASSVRCGRCKHELHPPASPMEMASSSDFDRLTSLSSIPVVVDFWAPWCGPCRMVAPELAKVAERNRGRLLIVKVNTDVLDDLANRFGIQSIPTLAVFVRGREVARTAGVRPARDIETLVNQAVASAPQRA